MRFFDWLFKKRKEPIKECFDYTKPNAFVHTWSVVDFSKKYGKMQIGKFPDSNNRESYQRCRFVDHNGKATYVNVSSAMQDITIQEIEKQRERIRVGELPNGKFVLYDFRWKDWEDVEL